MARGPDGKTVRPGKDKNKDEDDEESTRRVQRKSIRDRIASGSSDETETRIAGKGEEEEEDTAPMGRGGGYVDEPTNMEQAVEGKAEPQEQEQQPERKQATPRPAGRDAEKTQIYRPKGARPSRDEAGADNTDKAKGGGAAAAAKAEKPEMGEQGMVADPVVGWVVVVEGPGRGASFPLGYGNNRIGRAATETVSLDFGDGQISRENHATITYDGKNRRYFVKEGDGRNLIYVGDDPVLVPVELKGGESMILGETKLRFIPFCNKDFDWHDQ